MTEREADPNAPDAARNTADAASNADDAGPNDTAAAPPRAVDPGVERRAFVRRMGSDAVRTAGTVFSLSRILTRSATAAGQAVMGELESLQVAVVPESGEAEAGTAVDSPHADVVLVGPPGVDTSDSVAIATAVAVAGPPPAPLVQPEPVRDPVSTLVATPAVQIDADQRALLDAATSAVVAVNREGHPPQLTAATVLWDGKTLRFATLGWSRRTTMLRSDPRIGLLVDGPGGRFVTVTGRATILEGRHTHDAMLPLLLREADVAGTAADERDAAAETRWHDLVAADLDRAVIVIEPEQVLSGAR